jgi:DNA-directed RNA polymerase specialized sigma24 family protein
LLRRQPDRDRVFAWLCTVAMPQAYRLSQTERRHRHLEELSDANGWDALVPAHVTIDDHLEARSALRLLAELPERQRATTSRSMLPATATARSQR